MRQIITVLLRRAGYEIESAADGNEAWLKVLGDLRAYNVIITDSEMPSLDGRGLVKRLRDANYHGQIIVFSGSLSSSVADEFVAMGIETFVEKGSGSGVLLAAVERAVSWHLRTAPAD